MKAPLFGPPAGSWGPCDQAAGGQRKISNRGLPHLLGIIAPANGEEDYSPSVAATAMVRLLDCWHEKTKNKKANWGISPPLSEC